MTVPADDGATDTRTRRRRVPRWVRALLVLVALLVVLVIADRIADRVAARATATQLRESQHLAQDPDVDFVGFPFLTQALRGRFDEVDLDAADIPTPVLPLARAGVRLYGVHAGVADALDGQLQTVPVDRADATVLLRYTDLDPLLAARLAAAPGVLSSLRDPVLGSRGGQLAVTARAQVLGQTLPVEVDATVPVDATGISVLPQRVKLPLLGDQALPAALSDQLAVRVPTRQLPFGVRVRDVDITPDGLQISGDSSGFVVTTG